jgi:hypothetical protein
MDHHSYFKLVSQKNIQFSEGRILFWPRYFFITIPVVSEAVLTCAVGRKPKSERSLKRVTMIVGVRPLTLIFFDVGAAGRVPSELSRIFLPGYEIVL